MEELAATIVGVAATAAVVAAVMAAVSVAVVGIVGYCSGDIIILDRIYYFIVVDILFYCVEN